MPACKNCRELSKGNCQAYARAKTMLGRPLPPIPLGACEVPIVEDYLVFIERGVNVLEIGCGSWDIVKEYCHKVGAQYEGIDVLCNYFGKKTIATRIENLAQLTFDDERFELVIGNQSMEHWEEHGCKLSWGLYQCFRVCKPGGRVVLNVPIHFHGTKLFMLGRIEKLRKLFAPFSSQVSFHQWGEPSDPFPRFCPYPGYPVLRQKPPYVLDIQAIKDRPLPSGYSNRGAASGRMAQLLHYPVSYNIYRILKKLFY